MPCFKNTSNESSASDEANQLELHLQRQLEEDVASDTYTECNIIHQEEEILKYLKKNSFNVNGKEEGEEPEEFFTPKCISPYIDRSLKKSISSSPSTELTKEYYALVPIDGNLLDKELVEQDVLSTAFQSIIRSQGGDRDKINFQRNKPTSLALISSHLPKSAKHSNSCDILIKTNLKDDVLNEIVLGIEKKSNKTSNHNATNKQVVESNKPTDIGIKSLKSLHQDTEAEPVYSPDSLITDDPSSSSDYLSAAYTCSPGVVVSFCNQQLNVGTNITKMENIFTSSDSGLENTGLLESLTSHKDVTLTDMSLTESTLHDLTTDDGSNSHDSVSSPLVEKKVPSTVKFDSSLDESKSQTSDPTGKQNDMNCNSSKEEKQRQNEEIVILESSSLSSETGSWESVFPSKVTTKDVCEKFLHKERQNSYPLKQKHAKKELSNDFEDHTQSLVQKSPFKSTSCFIDAASLADEEDETIKISSDANKAALAKETLVPDAMIPVPSQPVPCSTHKVDISPNDWSENDNEDSLEQLDNKDPDSIQKDLSPTIFEMTPITEDSLCTNAFEQVQEKESVEPNPLHKEEPTLLNTAKDESILSNTVFVSNTPHNSIMSLKASALKQYESEESESDTTIVGRNCQSAVKNLQKYNESSPIISGGASVEDHLPNLGMYSGSPLIRRKIENTPIVSGAYVPPPEEEKQAKSPRPSCAPAWVVDMSSTPKCDDKSTIKKPLDKACDSFRNSSKNSNSLENCSKSRSSVDSDSSERSSHKFYIDLTNLPSPIPTTIQNESENTSEKKNMFSMYIDFGEKPTLKEIPARLSSLHTKKNSNETPKSTPRNQKPIIPNETPPTLTKTVDLNSTSIFEKFETLCDDPSMSISEIINLSERNRKQNKLRERVESESGKVHENESRSYCGERSLHRSLRSTIHEESINDQDIEPFVRLSDLDKPVQKANPPIIKKSERIPDERMTRSIPDSSWCEQQNQASTSRSNEIISSFHSENALSLNRLFPHLRNEFSRSMPGSLSSRTRSPLRLGVCSSPGDVDDQTSDTSDMSSVQSSFCRSIIENSTTEETSQASSLIGNCQSRLGQDLLRMFLEEIAPDVIVEVSGRRIKAHKCILSSRCQYFAGILSGGWVESAGNVIALPPFSFNVVQFALCHIYSGVSTIPDSISIVELATLADMLGLEGLKEAIMFTLKAKYCHHFHKPCAVCKAGVLECFPLCSVYGLDDLYRKCLKWIIKYFPWVWPTKAFATLPSELLEKCYHEIVINMTLENVIDTVYGCGFTVESLHHIRWGEVVARMCRRLVHAAAHFIAPKLVTVLRDIGSLPADPPPSAKQALDECMAAAIEWAPPDECCRAYALLSSVAREIRNHRFAKPDLITNGNQNNVPGQDNLLYVSAGSWLLQCEGALVRAAPRVCCTQAFIDLPSEHRRRLRELGCITYGGQPPVPAQPQAPPSRKSRTHHYKSHKPHSATSVTRSLEIDQMRASFVPYSPMPTAVAPPEVLKNSHLQDPKKINRPIPPKVRTTKAQEERAKFNMSKKNPSQERLNAKTTAKPLPFENAKARYLEPKTSHESYKKMPNTKKLVSKISSSESSRNSSPIQARNFRTGRIKSRPVDEIKAKALSQDSLATSSRPRTAEPSTDSLSESQTSNKYATYTKSKHTIKVAVDSVKSGRYATTPYTVATTNGTKIKTKIPVYLNSLSKSHNTDNKSHGESSNSYKKSVSVTKTSTTTTATSSTSLPHRNKPLVKPLEKATSCSLMNATKSSQAKMVAKVVKESVRSKPAPKNKGSSKRAQRCAGDSEASPVPIMERSGTFLKDEPTFGDKTTDIDLDH